MQRASASLANPFLSPEFALAVGRCRPGARVAVLTTGTSTAGFFPFERGRLGAGAPLLSWPGTLWQGLVHVPGADWHPRHLLRRCQLSVWRFDHLVAEQGPFVPYQAGLAASPVIDLTDGFAAYHAKLRAKEPRFRRDIARRARNLARDVGPVRFEADARDVTLLHTLMAWKSEQYRRMGVIDRFDRAWFVGLLEALLATAAGTSAACCPPPTPETSRSRPSLGCGAGIPWPAGSPPTIRSSPALTLDGPGHADGRASRGLRRRAIDMGEGAAGYKGRKSHDGYVAHGMVTERSRRRPATGRSVSPTARPAPCRAPRAFTAPPAASGPSCGDSAAQVAGPPSEKESLTWRFPSCTRASSGRMTLRPVLEAGRAERTRQPLLVPGVRGRGWPVPPRRRVAVVAVRPHIVGSFP